MTWHEELRENIRTAEAFRRFCKPLGLSERDVQELDIAIRLNGINLPRRYLLGLIAAAATPKAMGQISALIVPRLSPRIPADHRESANDQLAASVPDGDPLRGLTRMYTDRVLVSPGSCCMSNCQWCFRRKVEGDFLSQADLEAIFEYIERDNRIHDVILTGGEPLILPDVRLEQILHRLRKIPHVDIIRFHSRAPIVLPSRIDEGFLRLVRKYAQRGKPIYVVTHCVHPLELTEAVTEAIERLSQAGVPVFNQAPVLKGINDDQDTFDEWNQTMIRYKLKPYYVSSPLLMGDWQSHFWVPLRQVEQLLRAYAANRDGLGRPTLIVPVMGLKLTPAELEEEMVEHGAHVRRTKMQIT